MRRNYYRRFANQEQKKNLKRTFVFTALTLALLGVLFVFGIPAMAKVASFVSELVKSDKPIEISDNIPPAPPRFNDLPEATNKTNIEITGISEAGAKVTLLVNRDTQEAIVDSGGHFNLNVALLKGDNIISAKAKDNAGNESMSSEEVKLVFDSIKPDLAIDSPNDNSEYSGSSQRQVSIKGKTEPNTQLNINDLVVSVNSDGSFSFTTSLSEGENRFSIKVKDKAENETEKSLTLRFSP